MTAMTAMTAGGPPARDLPRLTSLRAFAAGAVFLYHAARHTPWVPFRDIAHVGFAGVGFFFVLSGFVLSWSTSTDVSARQFWRRRFARVYPSHLVTALVALGLPVLAYPVTPQATAANLMLVQSWFTDWSVIFGLNAVSWSLACEAFFYAVTPFLLSRLRSRPTRQVVTVALLWFATTSTAALLASRLGAHADVVAYANPLVRSGEFVLGCVLALLVQRGWRPRVPLSAALLLVTCAGAIVVAFPMGQSSVSVVMALPFALLVLAASLADVSERRGPLRFRLLVYLGQVSFAFYLVHELVLLNVPHVLGVAPSRASGLLSLALLLGVAQGLAMVLHHSVEKPMQLSLRGRSSSMANEP